MMNMRDVMRLLSVALVSGALVACTAVQAPASDTTGGTAAAPAGTDATAQPDSTVDPAATASPESEATSSAPSDAAVVPVDAAECEAIQGALAARLNVEFTLEEGEFSHAVATQQGTACTLTATGTGEDFGNFVDVAQSIREVLTAEGWTENNASLADGPTGTASGYELENRMAFVQVDWEPSEDADCADDQPISACDLEPSQQLFTVVVQLVQTPA